MCTVCVQVHVQTVVLCGQPQGMQTENKTWRSPGSIQSNTGEAGVMLS